MEIEWLASAKDRERERERVSFSKGNKRRARPPKGNVFWAGNENQITRTSGAPGVCLTRWPASLVYFILVSCTGSVFVTARQNLRRLDRPPSRPAEKLAVKRFMYPARYTHRRRRPSHVAIHRDLWRASVSRFSFSSTAFNCRFPVGRGGSIDPFPLTDQINNWIKIFL